MKSTYQTKDKYKIVWDYKKLELKVMLATISFTPGHSNVRGSDGDIQPGNS